MEHRWKVMIADDVEVFRRQIRRLGLWKEVTPFEICAEASDGIEALGLLEKSPVDLLITDIRMPRMDGLELLKETRSRSLARCVVFLSDYAEFSIAKEAIQYGIFDYLVKPVKEEELRSLLHKVQVHLEQEEKEAEEKRQLEEKLLESVHLYYPQKEVQEVVDALLHERGEALHRGGALLDATYEALGKDLLRTALVLDKAYQEILTDVENKASWLSMLYPLDRLKKLKLSGEKTVGALRAQLLQNLKEMEMVMKDLLPHGGENSLVRELEEFILNHPEEKLTLDHMAEKFYLTKNHLGEVFKAETGLTLGEYLFRVKIQRAKVLLEEDQLRSYEISERLGYQSAEYFAKQFKKATGETPSEYRAHKKRID